MLIKYYLTDVKIEMATIKDVAETAGVCVATVSRVMNNRGSISEKTRKKVLQAMKELDYHPNEMARSLQMRRTHIIGLVLPYLDHPFFSRLAEAVETACHKLGYKLMLCTSGSEAEKEREMVSMLRANKVDGILVCSRIPDASIYAGYDLPVVSIERTIDNVPSVSCDNYRGGMLAAQMLVKSGAKRTALIGNRAEEYLPASLRYQGFREACVELGLAPPVEYMIEVDDLFGDNFKRSMSDFIASHPDVDGFFATGDVLAVRALGEYVNSEVYKNREIRVIGFDGLAISEYLEITTIAQPISQMGEFAVDLLDKRISGKLIAEKSILPVTPIERRTVRGSAPGNSEY